jgi:hypothetical protein
LSSLTPGRAPRIRASLIGNFLAPPWPPGAAPSLLQFHLHLACTCSI